MACSSSSTGAGTSSGGETCTETGGACTAGVTNCCGISACVGGACVVTKSPGESCSTTDECRLGPFNLGTTGEDTCVASTAGADGGVSDGGTSGGKMCLVACTAKDTGLWICEDGYSGNGTRAFRCDGALYEPIGACVKCLPTRTNLPGTEGTLYDAVTCGTQRMTPGQIAIDYSIAGGACDPEGAEACSFDKSSELYCKGGTWVVKLACTGLQICGFRSPGINNCPINSSGCVGCTG